MHIHTKKRSDNTHINNFSRWIICSFRHRAHTDDTLLGVAKCIVWVLFASVVGLWNFVVCVWQTRYLSTKHCKMQMEELTCGALCAVVYARHKRFRRFIPRRLICLLDMSTPETCAQSEHTAHHTFQRGSVWRQSHFSLSSVLSINFIISLGRWSCDSCYLHYSKVNYYFIFPMHCSVRNWNALNWIRLRSLLEQECVTNKKKRKLPRANRMRHGFHGQAMGIQQLQREKPTTEQCSLCQ